jgi:hypothetical protein
VVGLEVVTFRQMAAVGAMHLLRKISHGATPVGFWGGEGTG